MGQRASENNERHLVDAGELYGFTLKSIQVGCPGDAMDTKYPRLGCQSARR